MKSRLIESIRVAGGRAELLEYHRERIERSLHAFGYKPTFDLAALADEAIYKAKAYEGVYKLRFEYNGQSVNTPTLTPYTPRVVERLIPCPIDDVACYTHKWADRSALEAPKPYSSLLDAEPTSELIYTYEGLLTDTRYSNIILDMGDGRWLTPEQPLLRGVMRQYLLDNGLIHTAELRVSDLDMCQRFRLINAMLPL